MLRSGFRFFSEWEGIDDLKLIQMGKAALQAVYDGALSMLTGSPGASSATPSSAFIGGNSFRPVLSSGLQVSIKPGRAIYVRSEKEAYTASGDMLGINVIPLLLNSASTVTHDAHDATHPRWDVISVKYTTSSGTSATIYKRMEGPSSVVTDTADTATHYAPTFTITKGTAASSPTVPTVPTDGMAIAHVYVPAGSGAVTVHDVRLVQRLGYGWADGPIAPTFGQPFVQSGCAATAPGGMSVTIASGNIYDGVATRLVEAATVTVSTAHATNPRIDLVYLDGGRVTYLAGTAASTPAAPSLPSGTYGLTQPLCEISVPALDTVIGSNQITDRRRTKPYVLDTHVEYTPTVYARVTVAAQQGAMDPNPDYRRVTVQAVDQEGNEIAGVVYFRLGTWADNLADVETVHDETKVVMNFDVTPIGQQIELGSNTTSAIVATDSTGEVVFDVSDASAGGATCYLKVTPIDWADASAHASASASEAAYKPGGETLRKVGFR